MDTSFDLTNAALAAAQRGRPVLLLRPGSKKPALHGGAAASSTTKVNVYTHVAQDTQREAISHMDRLLRRRQRAV